MNGPKDHNRENLSIITTDTSSQNYSADSPAQVLERICAAVLKTFLIIFRPIYIYSTIAIPRIQDYDFFSDIIMIKYHSH